MRRTRLLVLCLFLVLLHEITFAQVTGVYPFGPFDTPGFDTINRGNLNTHLSIPIFSKPGRGGSNFAYSLNYDGLIWAPQNSSGTKVWTPAPAWGWSDVSNSQWGYVTYSESLVSCTLPPKGLNELYSSYSNYVFHDEGGRSHPIAFSFTNTCGNTGGPTGSATYTLADNSGYTLYRSTNDFIVFTASGSQFAVPSFVTFNGYSEQNKGSANFTDTNGNLISVSSSGIFTDTMGRTPLTVSGVAPSPVVYTYTDSNGNSQKVTVNYSPYTVETAFGITGITEYSATSVPLVTSIVFSGDNTQYSFSYESTTAGSSAVTGRIASITLRTGGTISYTYTGIESDGTIGELTRTTSDGPTTYTRSGISTTQSTTTVVDAASNTTVSSFLINSTGYFFDTDRKSYAGSPSGTPLLEVQTCYNAAQNTCGGNSAAFPFSSVQTWTYQNGALTNEDYQQYAGPELIQEDVNSVSGITTSYNYTEYTGVDSIPFYRLSSVVSQGHETTLGYDETTPTPTSGLPQHSPVTTSRGNLTSVHQWTNSSGAALNTTIAYDDAGQVLSQTDTNGDVTKTAYDTSTDTLPTSITYPTVNGNVFSATFQFDPNTGLLLESTDINTQPTSYSYDGMLRQTLVSYPDTGKTTTSYSPNQIGTHRYQSTSVASDTEILYDGYGRQSRVAVANGQSGNPWYQMDTCYDSVGNVHFASYSYQGTGWATPQVCSGTGGDTFAYDALHRTSTVAHGDGTSVSYSYAGAATETTDENGVSRIVTMSSPGLIGTVCEISSNSTMPGSGAPVSCGTSISGTGFLTSYSYNLTNNQVTITQGSQSRVFQTDWAGRPILVQEPESGKTTYSYAYNATGLAVTRTRPTANQTNTSVTTTTTTQYDALNRPISITYSDGTPAKGFDYDVAEWGTLAQTNLKGRLSLALGSAGTEYSYDSMGRVIGLDECLPSGCGNGAYDRQLYYTYDLAGNMISSTDGAGVTSTYTISLANELQSLTSSLSNSTNPAGIISNVQNGPFGPSTYSLGNGLTSINTYDALGRTAGGWICEGTSQPNCTGGSAFYGFTSNWSGVRQLGGCDTSLNQCLGYGYDEFNRLTSRTVNSGTAQNYTYGYDRYGNRWNQTPLNGGLTSSLSFNAATNQITTAGYIYDAAGNMTNDGFHSYTYDGEGNVTGVDGGATATYVYNALNQRVRTVVGSTATEFLFNAAGQRVSIWNGTTHTQIQGQYYWGGKPVAYYEAGGTYFQHQDWLGTERMRTTYNGGVEGTFASLPWGDGFTPSGTDGDAYHFAELDHDYESDTDHAQFRQYSNEQGHWMSPDPYSGSYDATSPQSFNRYAYVFNSPLADIDPSGLAVSCQVSGGRGGGACTLPPGAANGLPSWSGAGAFEIMDVQQALIVNAINIATAIQQNIPWSTPINMWVTNPDGTVTPIGSSPGGSGVFSYSSASMSTAFSISFATGAASGTAVSSNAPNNNEKMQSYTFCSTKTGSCSTVQAPATKPCTKIAMAGVVGGIVLDPVFGVPAAWALWGSRALTLTSIATFLGCND